MKERIIEIVKEAGKIVLGYESRIESIELTLKEGQGVATEADVEVENFLIKELTQLKKAEILAEESFFQSEHNDYSYFTDKLTWVIDPIDGTNNFINSIPYYAICVALVDCGVPQIGVVYNPKSQECFVAEKGKGFSFYENELSDGKRTLKKSNSKTLKESIVSIGLISSKSKRAKQGFDYFKNLVHETRSVRKLGSAALSLCYVAVDRLDIFYEYSLKPWDIAAAALICQEAGVTVTDHNGSDFSLSTMDIAAGKEPLYSTTMKHLDSLK